MSSLLAAWMKAYDHETCKLTEYIRTRKCSLEKEIILIILTARNYLCSIFRCSLLQEYEEEYCFTGSTDEGKHTLRSKVG